MHLCMIMHNVIKTLFHLQFYLIFFVLMNFFSQSLASSATFKNILCPLHKLWRTNKIQWTMHKNTKRCEYDNQQGHTTFNERSYKPYRNTPTIPRRAPNKRRNRHWASIFYSKRYFGVIIKTCFENFHVLQRH
jgi:hypothetical protein